MVRSIGAQIGLLAFSAALLAGLYAGNSLSTVLVRAIVILLLASTLGQLVGWVGKMVLRDHLQRKKLTLDSEHRDAVRAITEEPAAPETVNPVEGG